MSHPPLSAAGGSAALAARPLRDAAVAGTAVVLALLALYAVFLDQGQLLSPVLGKLATSANYLHEFAHDGRHLLGAPCH
ncbi:CbtB-domain containing protein [Streptomyces flaveolus]|uniref:CbtB domain-containing protein n=1 Tax=Streptomyces flaveolus TaxID=67297 RepID=UPI003433E057